MDATRTGAPQAPPRAAVSSAAACDGSRFLPGTVHAGRYRVVGLLGRGGMGEVYRADDLKLGQPVALKFLPRDVEHDPARLERFRNEVRLALRITHPNVCRVHDMGEVDGQHFISMEYVDGEDLASLLRRIGRLPEERGLEIARQICAGLAAAHEEGILHRDLKPANVMIDGRGRARITDFGLVGLAGSIEGDEARAGTPGYMAPEQLAGGEVTTRSDVYALGLVLYEIFTGKAAFSARSAAEMARLQQSTPPTTPTSHVRGLDPAIDAVLLRALDPDPARRPASAVAVAAALPGGDPLAAALAAGETPSPEMVAEAGASGAMTPARVALAVLAILGCVLGHALVSPRNDVLGAIDTPFSIDALRERARLMSERLGFTKVPADTAHGLTYDADYFEWFTEDARADGMRDRIAAGRPAMYALWYRESPEPLEPDVMMDRVLEDDPPFTVPGMLGLRLDEKARLVWLAAVPPDRIESAAAGEGAGEPSPEAVWARLFAEADLDPERFTQVEPSRTPPHFADVRAAWEGTLAEAEDVPLRVEAAAHRGRPVSFRVVAPWTRDRGAAKPPKTAEVVLPYVFLTFLLGILIGLGLLARRNLNNGRSDLKGARRLGLYIFALELFAVLAAGGIFYAGSFLERFFLRLAVATFLAMIVFLAYVALEPYVRRLWPTTLISWSRLLAGRFGDPLVGRDLLIGAVFGVFASLLWSVHTRIPGLLGLSHEPLGVGAAWTSREALATFANTLGMAGGGSVGQSMLLLLSLVLLRLLLRSAWAAIGVFAVLAVVPPHLASPHPLLDMAVASAVIAATLFVTLRVGLLALMSMWFFQIVASSVHTLDPSSWMWESSIVSLVALALAAAFAAVVALGGRGLLQEDV